MEDLSKKKCIPCSIGTPPLKGETLRHFITHLSQGWKAVDEHHLEKEFTFKNFKQALDFTNLIGKIAEQEGHHPDIFLTWGKVKVTLWTHKIGGLSENDFIIASKIDASSQRTAA